MHVLRYANESYTQMSVCFEWACLLCFYNIFVYASKPGICIIFLADFTLLPLKEQRIYIVSTSHLIYIKPISLNKWNQPIAGTANSRRHCFESTFTRHREKHPRNKLFTHIFNTRLIQRPKYSKRAYTV